LETRRTILIFTDWYKPGYKAGGPVQSVFNLAELLKSRMDVKVVTRNTDLASETPYPDIQANVWTEIHPFHQVLYLDKNNQTFKRIKSLIKENKDNVIYINGLFSWYFSFLPALICTFLTVNSVYISVRGMLHKSALSVKPLKKQVFLAFARGFGLYAKPVLIASNEQEKEEIQRSIGKAKIAIAPNIPLLVSEANSDFKFKGNEGVLRILCLGRIAPEKNTLGLLEGLKRVDFKTVVSFCGGYIDQAYFDKFQSELKQMPVNVSCQYLGELLGAEVYNKLKTSDIMAMPSLGENFGHAIYESLAHGVPVIIGNNTPWKNLSDSKAGLEVQPDNATSIAEALNTFNAMEDEQFKLWKLGAAERAKAYLNSNNFEEIYFKLFA